MSKLTQSTEIKPKGGSVDYYNRATHGAEHRAGTQYEKTKNRSGLRAAEIWNWSD